MRDAARGRAAFQEERRRMNRRLFLLSSGVSALARPALAAPLPVPPSGRIGFRVLRNGTPIGEHHLVFTQNGGTLRVDLHVALLVRLAGISFFRYTAQATEIWSDGVFQSVDSQVNDNGNHLQVQAERVANGYAIKGTHVPRYIGHPNTLPLTYWNKAMLYGTILNIQTAHSYPAIVRSPGWNRLPTADGGTVVAQRFNVTGKLHLSVWYDQYEQWSGLAFHIDGYETYERLPA
jgi:hypothetical protein